MTSFSGFPEGKTQFTRLPDLFFYELLPQIDHLGELQLSLLAIFRLDHQEGMFRFLRFDDLVNDPLMVQVLSPYSNPQTELTDWLRRAVSRGTLLEIKTGDAENSETVYFLNTSKGRAAVKASQEGNWRVTDFIEEGIELPSPRPNIFRLYEENIGPLTPLIADALKDAESLYSAVWIEDAMRIAVENNKRSWSYIEAILSRWQEGGRDDRENRQDTEKIRRRYSDWEQSGG